MCTQASPEEPFCKEDAAVAAAKSPLSPLDALKLLARTARADAAQVAALKSALAAARQRIEPVAIAHQQAEASLKSGLPKYSSDVKSVGVALAQYFQSEGVAGSKGLPEKRQALRDKLVELKTRGAALRKAESDFGKARGQLTPLMNQLVPTNTGAALVDLKDANSIAKALLAQASKAVSATTAKPPAPAKAPTANDDIAQARVLATQIAELEKGTGVDAAANDKESKALLKLAAWGPRGDTLRPKDADELKALEKDQSRVDGLLRGIDDNIKAYAARHRTDAPSAKAKQCSIEKVDFLNFDYPGMVTQVRGGKAVGPDSDFIMGEHPFVSSVGYLDSSEGKKVAAVYIDMPMMGPHQTQFAEIHFFAVDDRCLIQHVDSIGGEIQDGKATGKSYTYTMAAYRNPTPEGQAAFADGQDKVEVRYFNDAIREVRRSAVH